MKKNLLVLMALVGTTHMVNAQQNEYIDRNFSMTNKPFNLLQLPGTKVFIAKGTANIEVMDFGTQGKTIVLTFECPDLTEAAKEEGTDAKTLTYFSWSGKKVHLAKNINNGIVTYVIMRGTLQNMACGAAYQEGVENGPMLLIKNDNGSGTLNYDVHKGMSRAELEPKVNMWGMKFEHTRNSGNLRVWTVKWLSIDKVYDLWGDVRNFELNNDAKYADFYFDANDRLVKWFFYM